MVLFVAGCRGLERMEGTTGFDPILSAPWDVPVVFEGPRRDRMSAVVLIQRIDHFRPEDAGGIIRDIWRANPAKPRRVLSHVDLTCVSLERAELAGGGTDRSAVEWGPPWRSEPFVGGAVWLRPP